MVESTSNLIWNKRGVKKMPNEFESLLLDVQKEYRKSNKLKDKIIILLIVLMFLQAVVGYSGFVWYESQFDYVEIETNRIY